MQCIPGVNAAHFFEKKREPSFDKLTTDSSDCVNLLDSVVTLICRGRFLILRKIQMVHRTIKLEQANNSGCLLRNGNFLK